MNHISLSIKRGVNCMKKKISIYTGNVKGINNKLYEHQLHPKYQILKVIDEMRYEFKGEKIIFTNSMYIIETFNILANQIDDCTIHFYIDKKEVTYDEIFDDFVNPAKWLLFNGLDILKYKEEYLK